MLEPPFFSRNFCGISKRINGATFAECRRPSGRPGERVAVAAVSPHRYFYYVITPTPRESCKRQASRACILICIFLLFPSLALRTRSKRARRTYRGRIPSPDYIIEKYRRRNEPVMRARADLSRGNIRGNSRLTVICRRAINNVG